LESNLIITQEIQKRTKKGEISLDRKVPLWLNQMCFWGKMD
jgi:hypothetical protein